jgi:hypothetical protein
MPFRAIAVISSKKEKGSPRLFGAYIGVVGEDWPSPQRGAFVQLAACIRQGKTRQDKGKGLEGKLFWQ